MQEFHFQADNIHDLPAVAEAIVTHLCFPARVYLKGEMGAGKTTLSKYLLHALGYQGEVTSPTYNLVQSYPIQTGLAQHMDLYRLEDPTELEFLALEDLWLESVLFLVEWFEKAEGALGEPDCLVEISRISNHSEDSRKIILKVMT